MANNAMTTNTNNSKTIRVRDGLDKLALIREKGLAAVGVDTRDADLARAKLLSGASIIEMAALVSAVNTAKANQGVYAQAVKAAVRINIHKKMQGKTEKFTPVFLTVWDSLVVGRFPNDALYSAAAAAKAILVKELAVTGKPNKAGGKEFWLNGSTMRVGNDSYSIRALTQALSIAKEHGGQIVVLNSSDELYASVSGVQIALGIVKGEVELGGLVSNPNHHLAIQLESDGTAKVLKDIWKAGKDQSNHPAAAALEGLGYLPSMNSEGYVESGYIQHRSTILPLDGSVLFGHFDKQGRGVWSTDAAKKMVVRLHKQIKQPEEVYSTTMPTVVIAGVANSIGGKERKELEKLAQCGAGYLNPVGFIAYGPIRAVGHKAFGPKIAAAEAAEALPDFVLEALEPVMEPFKEQPAMILPVTGIKSKVAKDQLNLQWKQLRLKNGSVLRYAVVEEADYAITDFYAAYSYEVVPSEEMGLSALRLALTRRLGLGQSMSVTAMVKKELGKGGQANIADTLASLEDQGIIRRKDEYATTNLQMLQSMDADYGRAQTEAFLRAAIKTPMAKGTRADATMVTEFLDGVDVSRIHQVDLSRLIGSVSLLFKDLGLKGEYKSTVPAVVMSGVLGAMLCKDKDWVQITYKGESVTIPGGARLTRNVRLESNTATSVVVEGYIAELMQAIWFAASQETLSDNMATVTLSKIGQARDSILGKRLAQIGMFGANGAIVPKWDLKYNEVASPALSAAKAEAEAFYGKKCRGVYAKPPCIMSLAVAGVDIKYVAWCEDAHLLYGTLIYANADFILDRQDDSDGDRATVAIVPSDCLFKNKLGAKAKRPTDVRYNPMAKAVQEFVKGEKEAFFVDTTVKAKKPGLISWDEIIKAVIESAEAKANVGMFTAAQQKVHTHAVVAAKAVEAALQRGDFISYAALLLAEPNAAYGVTLPTLTADQVKDFGREFVNKVIIPTQGAATQADSMDRIKHVEGVEPELLANILAPRSARFGYTPVNDADALAVAKAGGLREETMVGLSDAEVIEKIKTIRFKGRTKIQSSLFVMAKKYQYDVTNIGCVKYIARQLGLTNPALINAVALALTQVAVSAVGHFRQDVLDRNEAIFGNDRTLEKAGGLEEIAKLRAADTLQGTILRLLAYKR